MTCAICNKQVHGERHDHNRDWNIHHRWFPKCRFKRSRKRKETMVVHIACHNDFNFFFSNHCQRSINCFGCKYGQKICCYYENA